MARTYSSTPVLSKIKLGENTYYLKDADARAILDAINANVYESLKLDLGTVADGGDNLVTAANIKTYVDQIAELGFEVKKVAASVVETADATKYETYHNMIVLVEDATAIDACIEYIITRDGEAGSYTYAWERIGTTQTDLDDYLTAITYNAQTHVLSETKGGQTNPVHTFGNLADANTASTDYTPAGTITVNLTQTTTTATIDYDDYTPEGSISSVTVIDTVGTAASKAADTFTAGSFTQGTDSFTTNVPTSLDLTKFDGGSKAKDTFTAGSLPSKAKDTFTAGSLPSLGAATTATFTTEGVTVALDSTDTECLVFTDASTATAVTAQGAFDQGSLPSFTEGAFDAGALPSFTEGTYTPASLATGFYTKGTAAAYTQGTDSFTAPTFEEGAFTPNVVPTTKPVTPTFTGTKAENVIAKTVTYDKATSAGATFAGTQATITVIPDAE